MAKFSALMNKAVHSIAGEALERLMVYSWPGNVRELENVIERAVALEQTPVILADTLPAHVRAGGGTAAGAPVPADIAAGAGQDFPSLPELGDGFDLEARGDEFYRHYISLALERAGGVQTRAAELLGMSFRSFRYYAKKFNIR